MKIGLVSAILADYGFEKMVDTVSELGFDCVEVACWPCGKAERRYAGVSHIDVDELDEARRDYILDYCAQRKVEISSLAFYPNTLDGDPLKRAANIEHLKKVIRASAMLGVNMVTTFIGRVQDMDIEGNLREVAGGLAGHHAARGGAGRASGDRKLPYALRPRPVARRPEPHDHPRHLAAGL